MLIKRTLSGLVDVVLILISGYGLFYTGMGVLGFSLPPRYWNYLDYFADVVNKTPRVAALFIISVVLAGILYNVVAAFLGRTPGMLITNLRFIKRSINNRSISSASIVYRLVFFISRFLVFFLGSVMGGLSLASVIWSGGKRGIHDVIFGVEVV